MNVLTRLSMPVLATAMAGFLWTAMSAESDAPRYCPAYLETKQSKAPQLVLFPPAGQEVRVTMPTGLPSDFNLIGFSPDGKSIYGQRNDPRASDGIVQIEFRPTRQRIVNGSVGLHIIWNLTVSPASNSVFVSGWSKTLGKGDCGTFKIDTDTGTFRTLRQGIFPDCGGGGGPVSPNGKRVLHSVLAHGNQLRVLDLGSEAIRTIGSDMSGATWSPDGRWIAAIEGASGASSVILIDATDTSRRRNLGRTDDSQTRWSPDSKYLLLAKPERQCGGYFRSLETIDVLTSKRTDIESSRCKVLQNATGWMDLESVK